MLILHSYHKGLTWTDSISRGIEEALHESDKQIKLTFEYMDTKRIWDAHYLNQLRKLYRYKYADHHFDAIIASDDHAFQFLRAYHKTLFPGTPIVFCGVNSFADEMLKDHPLITGVLEACDMRRSIEIALTLQPHIKAFYVLVDHTVSGQANKKLLMDAIPFFRERVSFFFLEGLSMSEACRTLATLPPNSASIILNFTTDTLGNSFSFQKSVKLLSSAAEVPMYSFWDFYMGHGIIGGRLTSGRHQGRQAAKILLDILDGRSVASIPVLKESPNYNMFDFRQLKRYGIRLSRLPAECIVINQPISVLSQHRELIFGIVAGFIGLSAIIALLSLYILTRRRAEKALRESEEYYRQFFEGDLSGVYITKPSGQIVACNHVFAEMIGLSHVEAALKTNMISYYRYPEDRSDLIRRLKKHKKIEHFELELKQADGTPLQVLVNAIGRFDEDGELTEILGYIMDVTHQKCLEKQLLQAQKMESIGTMAGGVAHDFNNLMMGIQGNVSMLLMDKNQDHRSQKRLENIMSLIERGSKLTHQLLGFAKSGKYEVKPSDLNKLVRRNSKVFRRTKKGLRVLEDFDPDLWAVDADRSQIDQVFFNLYVNADHAMGGSGTLTLRSQNMIVDERTATIHKVKPGRFVAVSVSDTGVGMDETTLKRIFDPFFTTKEMGHGTGLGLASVYGIIKNHGGYITVSSRVGQGTCFNIHLPESESEVAGVGDQASIGELRKGSETILVVDDEKHNLEISKEMLEFLGYTVLTANSGRKAIEIYSDKGPVIDMVVLDIIMPDLSGGKTFDALKQINSDICVLLASGYSINDEAASIIQRGCYGFIQKPFAVWEIAQKVREILDKKRGKSHLFAGGCNKDRSLCLDEQA